MKFAEHLAAHITPEWRKQYIQYEALKEMLYAAVDQAPSIEESLLEPVGASLGLSGWCGTKKVMRGLETSKKSEFPVKSRVEIRQGVYYILFPLTAPVKLGKSPVTFVTKAECSLEKRRYWGLWGSGASPVFGGSVTMGYLDNTERQADYKLALVERKLISPGFHQLHMGEVFVSSSLLQPKSNLSKLINNFKCNEVELRLFCKVDFPVVDKKRPLK
ncbi:hypothetical protein TURU_050969 [Turdus rufiventris]|nr:hypothetical protein TURU_050969 [Turdus rufiventris]